MNYSKFALAGTLAFVCLVVRHFRPKQNGTLAEPTQTQAILGVYIDESDRFILSRTTSRHEHDIIAKGRLLTVGSAVAAVEAFEDSFKNELPVGFWNRVRHNDKAMALKALDAMLSYAQCAFLPICVPMSLLNSPYLQPGFRPTFNFLSTAPSSCPSASHTSKRSVS